MKNAVYIIMVIGFVCALHTSPAMAVNRILAIGDSWGDALPDPLNSQLASHGHADYDVFNFALAGVTADAYAHNVGGALDLTLNLLVAMPTIEVVFISLGGNDLWALYPAIGNGAFAEIEADLRYLVDRILATRPDVDILFAAYDILKFDKSEFCLLFAYSIFGKFLPWEVSPLFIEIGNVQQRIDNDYPAVTYLNLWGTGQGNPGSPDISSWSPSSYVGSEDEDCIHLSDSGYNQFALQIYCQYFAPRFGQSCSGSSWGVSASAEAGSLVSSTSVHWNGLAVLVIPLFAVIVWKRMRKR